MADINCFDFKSNIIIILNPNWRATVINHVLLYLNYCKVFNNFNPPEYYEKLLTNISANDILYL